VARAFESHSDGPKSGRGVISDALRVVGGLVVDEVGRAEVGGVGLNGLRDRGPAVVGVEAAGYESGDIHVVVKAGGSRFLVIHALLDRSEGWFGSAPARVSVESI